jgi:hypothetical protein
MRENLKRIKKELELFVKRVSEQASETREAARILKRYARDGKVSQEDEEIFREQFIDMLKIIGIGIPFSLIPGATVLLPAALSVAKKFNINLLPSSFRERKKDLIRAVGIMDWEPENKTRKHQTHSKWKRVAMIKTGCDLEMYYAWFLERRFNLVLNKTIRGSHVTFISEEIDFKTFEEASNLWHGKELEFFYEIEPRTDGKHWWLRVHSPQAEEIRQSLGLEREPYFAFHLTLGHANEKWIEHSEYVLRQCKKFHLISNEPRRQFNEDRVIFFPSQEKEL